MKCKYCEKERCECTDEELYWRMWGEIQNKIYLPIVLCFMKKKEKSLGTKVLHASVLLIATTSLVTTAILASVIARLPFEISRPPREEQ